MSAKQFLKPGALALVAAFAMIGLCTRAAAATEHRVMGTLEKLDHHASTFTIKPVPGGDPLTVHWSKETRFRMQGKTINASELKAGERLNIRYEQSGKEAIAKEVLVQAQRPVPAVAAPERQPDK